MNPGFFRRYKVEKWLNFRQNNNYVFRGFGIARKDQGNEKGQQETNTIHLLEHLVIFKSE
jgi:hypothetical protein